MTIEREADGLHLLTVICDQCGERRDLDVDPEAVGAELRPVFREIGWVRRPAESVRFPDGIASHLLITYEQDFCPDCQSDEPRPHPLYGSGRVCRMAVAPMTNDPVDEWPRAKVWEAAGLNLACGHPPGPAMCPWCERGDPPGDTRPAWRR